MNSNKTYSKVLGKKPIAFMLVIVSLFTATLSTSFFTDKPSGRETANAQEAAPQRFTQAVNDASRDIAFEFVSDKSVNESNFTDYIGIANANGSIPACRFKDGEKNKFSVLAPIGGYEDGDTYIISLQKGVRFANEDHITDGKFYFTIKRDEVANVALRENVKTIQGEKEAEFFSDNIVRINNVDGTLYSDGEIILVNIGEEQGQVALKIEKILESSPEYLKFVYDMPTENEVVSEADVYLNQNIEFDESWFSSYWEEEVVDNILGTSYFQNMHEVANAAYAAKMSAADLASVIDVVSVIPTISIKAKSYTPFELIVTLTWNSNNIAKRDVLNRGYEAKSGVALIVKVEFIIKNETKTFVSEKNGVRNTATLQTNSTSLTVTVGAGYKTEILSAIGEKYQSIKYDDLDANRALANQGYENVDKPFKNMTPWSGNSKNAQTHNLKLDYYAMREAAAGAWNAKVYAAKDYMKNNKDPRENTNNKLFVLKTPPIPLGTPAITLTFSIEPFIDFSINAEVGTQHIWKTTTETGIIECDGETQSYNNEVKEYTGNVHISGKIDVKIGIRVRAFVTFFGIVQLGVQGEIGVYAEAQGMFSMAWGSGINNPDTDAKPWAYTFDVGWYWNIKAYVKLWIFNPYEYTIVEKEHSFLPSGMIGQKTMQQILTKPAPFSDGFSKLYDSAENGETLGADGGFDFDVINLSAEGYAKLPNFYRSVYDMETGESTVSDKPLVLGKDYVIGSSNYVYYDGQFAYLRDCSISDFEEIIFAYLIIDGQVDDNTFLPIIIKKDPVKVESIAGYTDYAGIQVGGSVSLSSRCYPADASYQASEFELAYVLKNNVKIENGLAQYASVDGVGLLRATNALSIGDRIGVRAHAVKDDIWSEPFEIEVIKTPVADVRIIAEDFRRSIGVGERVEVLPKIYPLEASFPVEDVFVNTGSQYGRIVIENGRYYLECFEGTPLNTLIGVIAVADEGDKVSEEYVFTVGAVAVESIAIEDEFGNKLLARRNVNEIEQGAQLKLKPVFSPTNATVDAAEFIIIEGGTSATVDENGVLKIGARAKIGATIVIIATADNVNSSEYSFVVSKIAVEAIELRNYQGTAEVKPGGTIQFYPVITPVNATYVSPAYSIIDGFAFANISALGTLTVSQDAPIGGIVTIRAIADGVEAIYSLTVIPILAEQIILSANTLTITEGEALQLQTAINPAAATYASDITFEIIEGGEYAIVNSNGYITVNGIVSIPNAVFKVRANLDGIYSNILSFNIYVPVRSVAIVFDGGITEMQVYMSESFGVFVNPAAATDASEVEIIVTNNAGFVSISEGLGHYYVTVNQEAVIGDRFSIAAIVDGVRSGDYFITVVKTPVAAIDLRGATEFEIGEGKSFTLNATVAPLNASYPDIGYQIVSGFDIADIIPLSDGRFCLQVQSGAANVGRVITVLASADGVTSAPLNFTVVQNNVDYVIISDAGLGNILRPNEITTIACEVNADATYQNAIFRIVSGSEYAVVTDVGILTINKDIFVPNASVEVVAFVDGVESNTLVYSIFVPISHINVWSSEAEARTNTEFAVYSAVNNNATDTRVILSIVSGGQYVDNVSLDEFGNATYRVRTDITVPDAEVVFKASGQGIESQEITVGIIVPITEVVIAGGYNASPKQGEKIFVNATSYPTYATYGTITYRLINNILGVTVDSASGEISVAQTVPVGTVFSAIATADGVDSTAATFIVQKVPVEAVALSELNAATAVRVGESVNLVAAIFPSNATYKTVTWTIIDGGMGVTIADDGRVDVSALAAIVGAVIKVKATVDGVDSNIYELIIQKQPVTDISLDYDKQNTVGEDLFLAGDTIKLLAFVNENATFPDIDLHFISEYYIASWIKGAKYGDIQEFYITLAISPIVNIPNAYFTFYISADGVNSRQITLYIYNPITDIAIDYETAISDFIADAEFALIATTNDGMNNSTVIPAFVVIQGGEYLEEIAYGQYKIKSADELALIFASRPNRSKLIRIQASGDGVYSNIIERTLLIPVTGISFNHAPETVTIGDTDKYVEAVANPDYASEQGVTYSITNQALLPFVTINSLSGALTIQNNRASIGQNIIVRAIAANGVYAEVSIEILRIPLDSFMVYSNNEDDKAMPGTQVELGVNLLPLNATYGEEDGDVEYLLRDDALATINGNILTVKSTTPIGVQIAVYAYIASENKYSDLDYIITVSSVPATAVTLKVQSGVNINDVRGGQQIQFSVEVKINGVSEDIDFPIVYSVSDFGAITNDGLLTIDSDVKNNTVITITAVVAGVTKTANLTVKVPIAVTQSTLIINEGETASIELSNPALYTAVQYELSTTACATINLATGIITAKTSIKGNSKFKAYVYADGVKSEEKEFTVFVPVKNLSFDLSATTIYSYTTQALMDANSNDRITLSATFNNTLSSNTSLRWKIMSGENYVSNKTQENGDYYITDKFLQVITNIGSSGKSISLRAEVYGQYGATVYTESQEVTIRVPVESVSITRALGTASSTAYVQQDMSYTYTATIYPTYATSSAITWAQSNTSIGTLSAINGAKTTLSVSAIATLDTSFDIIATADGKSKNCLQVIERVWTNSLSFSLNSQKQNSDTAVYTKVYTGDVLTPLFTYSATNVSEKNAVLSFNSSSLVKVNSYAEIIDNKIYIKSTADIRTSAPNFYVYAWATKKDGTKTLATSIYINVYIPVEGGDISIILSNVSRDEWNALGVTYNSVNGGYANSAAKSFTAYVTSIEKPKTSGTGYDNITNTDNRVNFDTTRVYIPKDYPAGTQIKGYLRTPDGGQCSFAFTVTPLSLSASNIYYNTNTDSYSGESVDSASRSMYDTDSAQLEEGKYTYVLGKYGSSLIADYGVTYTITDDSAYAELSGIKLTISSDAPGTAVVTLTIVFKDGTKNTTVTKKIKIFNAINGATLATTAITSNAQQLSIGGYDSKASYVSSNIRYKQAVTNTYYTISATGYVSITNKALNHTTSSVRITYYCDQPYNGTIIQYSATTYLSVEVKSSYSETRSTDLDNVSSTRSETVTPNFNMSALKAMGYTQATITVSYKAKAESFWGGGLRLNIANAGNHDISHGMSWADDPFVYTLTVSLDTLNSSNGAFNLYWSKTGACEYCVGTRTITITAK
jgi:hypothetical protein